MTEAPASSPVACNNTARITTVCSVNIVPASTSNDAWQKQQLKPKQQSNSTPKLMDMDSNSSLNNTVAIKSIDGLTHQTKPIQHSQNHSNNTHNMQIDLILNSAIKVSDEQIPIKTIFQSTPDRIPQSYFVVRGQPGTQDSSVQYLVPASRVQLFQQGGFQIPITGKCPFIKCPLLSVYLHSWVWHLSLHLTFQKPVKLPQSSWWLLQ